MVVGLFYHLYVHDKEGSIGNALRSTIHSSGIQGTMDDKLFATIIVTSFMQISGMLMLPEFFGPSYNLFLLPKRIFLRLTSSGKKKKDMSALVKKEIGKQSKRDAVVSGGKRKNKSKKKTN